MVNDPASSPPPSESQTPPNLKSDPGAGKSSSDSEELKGYKLLVKLLKNTKSGQTDYDSLLADLAEPNLKKATLQKRVSRCLIRLGLSREEVGLAAPRGPAAGGKGEKVEDVGDGEDAGKKKEGGGKRGRPAKKRKRGEVKEEEVEVGWKEEEEED